MGGTGSGRCGGGATTSNYHQLDVRDWHRHGWLGRPFFFCHWWKVEIVASTHSAPEVVWLYQRSQQPGHGLPDRVRLEWTCCNYGGSRPWFLCPERGCGRRVAILYVGSTLACRRCRHLAYDSQQDSGFRRLVRRGRAIRLKLGGSPSLTDPFPDKPKGMHWRTYLRSYVKASLSEGALMASIARWLDRVEQTSGCNGRYRLRAPGEKMLSIIFGVPSLGNFLNLRHSRLSAGIQTDIAVRTQPYATQIPQMKPLRFSHPASRYVPKTNV
jgi:hypothetical protein